MSAGPACLPACQLSPKQTDGFFVHDTHAARYTIYLTFSIRRSQAWVLLVYKCIGQGTSCLRNIVQRHAYHPVSSQPFHFSGCGHTSLSSYYIHHHYYFYEELLLCAYVSHYSVTRVKVTREARNLTFCVVNHQWRKIRFHLNETMGVNGVKSVSMTIPISKTRFSTFDLGNY